MLSSISLSIESSVLMKTLQKLILNKYLVFAIVMALQAISLFRFIDYLPSVFRPLFVLVSFIVFPGTLTSLILYRKSLFPIWQIVGLGIGFGIGEMLLFGRLLLIVGASTPYLGYVIFGMTLVKVIWLCSYKLYLVSIKSTTDWRLFIIPLLTLLLIWLTMIQINLGYPAYPVNTFQLNDKWSYLAVIEQFLSSPNHLNLRPDTIIFGTNTRLSWNSWLYFIASMSYFTNIHPIQLIFQTFRPSIFFITFFSSYLLGYQLFRKHWLAFLATVLHILFAIGLDVEGFWFWMRLEEDKYFAFMTLMPIAWVFLLRVLDTRRRSDLFGLMVSSMSLALVHPLGIPALLLLSVPISLLEWLLNHHKGFDWRWLLITLLSIGVFIVITLFDKILVSQTPYVQQYIQIHGSLPSYDVSTVPNSLPAYASFVILTLIPLGIFAKKDRVARFLFLVTIVCLSILCVPIIAATLSIFTTSVGISRYNWLIPYGFIVTWIISKVLRRLSVSKFKLHYTIYIPAVTIVVVIVISSWNQWTITKKKWLFSQNVAEPSVLSTDIWQGFLEAKVYTDNKRTVTPNEYGFVAPTLWPKAELLIFNSPIHAPIYWPQIEDLYQINDIATAWMILDNLQPHVLLVPSQNGLSRLLAQNPVGIESLYSNKDVSVFAVDVPSALKGKDDAFAFVAHQYTLKFGECTFLSWDTENFSHIQLNGQDVASIASQSVCPRDNKTYVLQGNRVDGSLVAKTQHIFVSKKYDYMASFYADKYIIKRGECVVLRWQVEGIDKVYFQERPTVGESFSNECPSYDSLYSLRVVLRNQETIMRNITIYVGN